MNVSWHEIIRNEHYKNDDPNCLVFESEAKKNQEESFRKSIRHKLFNTGMSEGKFTIREREREREFTVKEREREQMERERE